MNTLLPYPDFRESLACLDDRTLDLQRYEVLEVASALVLGSKDPVVRLWRGSGVHLMRYGEIACEEAQRRGVRDRVLPVLRILPLVGHTVPSWLGGELHQRHRALLLRRDPVFYGGRGWRL